MLNPSYLIKSRHDIYYFRYPLPASQCGEVKRISISLKTRCPKEALRLAKTLEYHSFNLIEEMNLDHMNNNEIVEIVKSYYAAQLDAAKQMTDNGGFFGGRSLKILKADLDNMNRVIEGDYEDYDEMRGVQDEYSPYSARNQVNEILDKAGIEVAEDSDEFEAFKHVNRYAARNFLRDWITYNEEQANFSLLETPKDLGIAHVTHNKPKDKLDAVIAEYLNDIKPEIEERSLKEQEDCLRYLQDLFGGDCFISEIDFVQAREVKQKLRATPTRRNVAKLTRGLPLLEQISVAEAHDLDRLSPVSVSKYMAYFKALFEWARKGKMVPENVFEGVADRKNKKQKKKNRRDMFSKDEVSLILKELEANESGKVKNASQYWGTLIAIYTGARRNEIAALMVDDVKQDEESGIWYFNITDEEEEGKEVKTEAGHRVVPIHSKLFDLGFMAFLEEAKKKALSKPETNGMKTRLLFELTYTKHDKWGRKLGQFVNDRLLEYLGLRVKNKKTLHSLRHSFITFLDVAKVKAENIKSMVGHEQGTVTHGVYTHYGVEYLPSFKEEIEKLPY